MRCRVQRPVGWRATIKLERDAGLKGLSVGGQRYKPVTKGRISAETVKKYIEEQKLGGENMATRNKHIRTPYEDERKKHRAAASRHVLVLEVQIKEDDKRKLFHIANDLRIYGNHLTNIAQKARISIVSYKSIPRSSKAVSRCKFCAFFFG